MEPFILEIAAGVACLCFGGSYLYILSRIRVYLEQSGLELDNISALNLFKIYWLYSRLLKETSERSIVLYFHLISFGSMIFLIYKLQEMGL